MEKKFGLIGSTVSHSFSKSYFDEKFFREGLRDYHYDLYPLNSVDELKKLLDENPELYGLNVTIPYKEQVLKFLTDIDPVAKKIGAVNVIKIHNGKLTGFNTDSDAFYETVERAEYLAPARTASHDPIGGGRGIRHGGGRQHGLPHSQGYRSHVRISLVQGTSVSSQRHRPAGQVVRRCAGSGCGGR